MSAKQIVEEAIQNNKVVVFSKSYCRKYYIPFLDLSRCW